jgi:hypothetical protein
MLHSLHPGSKQPRFWMRAPAFATFAALIGACVVMPGHSFGARGPSKCSSPPVTSAERCHLDSNDRMKMELGDWGNGVHPSGPNYFCMEHQRQLEVQARICR